MNKLPELKFKRKNSKGFPVLDVIDVHILNFLEINNNQKSYVLGKKLIELSEYLSMSHTALLVHLTRLKKLKLIHIKRTEPRNTKKLVYATDFGKKIGVELYNQLDELNKPRMSSNL